MIINFRSYSGYPPAPVNTVPATVTSRLAPKVKGAPRIPPIIKAPPKRLDDDAAMD